MAQRRRQQRRYYRPYNPRTARVIRQYSDVMVGAGVLMIGAGTLGLVSGVFNK